VPSPVCKCSLDITSKEGIKYKGCARSVPNAEPHEIETLVDGNKGGMLRHCDWILKII
jgi:hypothetical protein